MGIFNQQLDNLIKPHLATIGKLANRLQRLLLAKQNTSWNYNLEEGILDNARLHRVIASPGYPAYFNSMTYNTTRNSKWVQNVTVATAPEKCIDCTSDDIIPK